MKKIVLIGGGGHCKSCIDVIKSEKRYKITGILDNNLDISKKVLGYSVLGTDKKINIFIKQRNSFLICIGQIKDPTARIKIYKNLKNLGANLPFIKSSSSIVSDYSIIGEGTIVMHNSIINSDSIIGANCIINNNSLIEHDVVIEDHSHVSTGAIINGGVKIGKGVFIGSGAVIKHGLKIGDKAIIGIGKVIRKNIKSNSIVI
jgi:sugar O-acyltransferase (sialic acid O-acetyltransferase NeuD family)